MNYNIIQSGSKGNAVIYDDKILVDCGVSYHLLPKGIRYCLLTHEHGDHFKADTIVKLYNDGVKIIAGEWLEERLHRLGVKFIKSSYGKVLKSNQYTFSMVKLYHDVENCGWRIFVKDYKILHATDTSHLRGIKAKDYDLYAIEHNYDEEEIQATIELKMANKEFAYEKRVIETHLSIQQAERFIEKNARKEHEVLKLHQHSK